MSGLAPCWRPSIPAHNQSGYEPNRSGPRRFRFRKEEGTGVADTRSRPARPSQILGRPWLATVRLIARQPGFAEAHFRLARLSEWSGLSSKLPAIIVWQGTWTGFPNACQTSFRDAYRRVAERHACILIDGSAELRALSPHGIRAIS